MANRQTQTIGIIVVIVVVLAIIGLALSSSKSSSSGSSVATTVAGASTTASSAPSGTYPILMSDPQQVPRGTKALFIAYSSVQAHVAGTPSTAWVNAQGSGSINLTAIQNKAQVIALANLSSGANIDMVRFLINSASIVINGTTYNVQAPSSYVTATVYSNTSAPGVLVEMTPGVITLYSNVNGTSFFLSPSVKAVPATNVSASASIGAQASLGSSAMMQLTDASPQLQVATAALTYQNSTEMGTLSITLRNNGNRPAILQNVYLYGNQSVLAITKGSFSLGLPAISAGSQSNITIMNGAPVGFTLTSQTNASIANLVKSGITASSYAVMPFQIQSGGTMLFITTQSRIGGSTEVPPDSSATLTYSGPFSTSGGYLEFRPVAGQTYTIVVQGMNGTTVATTTQATLLH